MGINAPSSSSVLMYRSGVKIMAVPISGQDSTLYAFHAMVLTVRNKTKQYMSNRGSLVQMYSCLLWGKVLRWYNCAVSVELQESLALSQTADGRRDLLNATPVCDISFKQAMMIMQQCSLVLLSLFHHVWYHYQS